MKSLASSIRNASEKILGQEDAPDAATTTARLAQCLARALEKGYLNLDQVYEICGAPGDWGYSTPVGKALHELYSAGAEDEEAPATNAEIVTFPRRPERDEKGRANLYPGMPMYKGHAAILRSKWGTPRTEAIIMAPTLEALAEFYAQTFSVTLDPNKTRTAEITATDIPLS